MSLKAADVDRVFQKLRMEIKDAKDRHAWFVYQGKRVLHSMRSHGRGDIPGKVGNFIRQQLKVNETQFSGLRDCSVTYDDYVAILQTKQIIPKQDQQQ